MTNSFSMVRKARGTLAEQKKESKKPDPYRVVIISEKPQKNEYFYTAGRITEEGEKLGHEVYVVNVDGAYIKLTNDKRTIHNSDDDKGFDITSTDTVVFVRGSVRLKESWLDLISLLGKTGVSRGHGLCLVNDRETIEICSDKYRSYVRLDDFGLTQPKTVLVPNKEGLKRAVETLDKDFPIVLKTLKGSKGVGVVFIESERSLDAIVQLIFNQDENADLLIQEYIKTDYDVRVLVLGGRIMSSMRRDVIEGDFRSNFSRGGKVSKFELTDLEAEQCILAAKAVNGLWTAVDFIVSEDRKKIPPYILEVNHSPGTEGIEKASGVNICKELIQFFDDPEVRRRVPSQVGFLEVLNIKPFGDIVAKFDTGNALLPVIHATNLKIKGEKVTWELLGKTITSDIVRVLKVNLGGLRDYIEERFVVKLDVEFLGHIYKEVEFTLDDRKSRSKILLNRSLMRTFNVMVNPDRKYIVTTKKVL
jgi:ribosomal protein S6--L-glutamate ligase